MTHYITTDMPLAVALSVNFPLVAVDKEEPRKARFAFVDTPELQSYITDYWAKKLLVEPLEYFAQLKNLKARLYS